MSPRLLILTAGFGEGHNAAARALSAAWQRLHGEGSAPVADVFALSSPRANALVRRSYLALINRVPGLWRGAYAWLDRSTIVPHMLRSFRGDARVLESLIARERPDAICCTFPAYAFHLEALARRGRVAVPFFNLVTDSISINSLWWRPACAGWFVPNGDSADVLLRAGIPSDRVHVSGFPVPLYFAQEAGRLVVPDLGRGAVPRVLYIVNSGTRGAGETARRLLADTRWEITCTVGRNEALRAQLTRAAATRRPRAEIIGWTDEMPRLLMTHHIVVSKAGGATTQEALAARCPMIVNQIVPGQEEGNYELLRRYGVGALATTPESVISALALAFADGGKLAQQWREALGPISRPWAAVEIAEAILAHARSAGERKAATTAITAPVPKPALVAVSLPLSTVKSGGEVPTP